MKRIEIKRMSSSEENISKRSITYDVYLDGEYYCTFDSIVEAIDFYEEFEFENSHEEK